MLEALGAATLFGVSTPLAKMLLGSVTPLMLAGLLYAGSGLGLLLVLAGRRFFAQHDASIALPRRHEWFWLVGAIFFGGVAGPIALMFGLMTSAASTASLLLNLEAVFTALLAWFVFRENFDRRIVLGMGIIIAGGLLLAWEPDRVAQGSFGLIFIALACLCWGIDNNLTRKVSASDALVVACLKGTVAGAVNLGLAMLLGNTLPPVDVLAASMFVGFLGYGVSLVLFVRALRQLGTARTAAYFSVAPFFGAAVAVLVQSDPVTWQLIGAGTLMACGIWVHVTERHLHAHRHDPLVHAHSHVHDEHHQHEHDADVSGNEPHTHVHQHQPIRHSHAHVPDVHHRHRH